MDNDNLGDWRIRAVTALTKDVPAAFPGGPSHKAGAPVYQSTLTKNAKGQYIGFITPHPTALALNIAHRAGQNAKRLRDTIRFVEHYTPYGIGQGIANDDHSNLFDYFEECMIAITFSFQAIETFANDIIANNFHTEYKLKQGEKETTYSSAEELQRIMPTEIKIGEVLPSLLNMPSPKQNKFWRNFKELKKVRDSTIHLKSSDAYNLGNVDKESLFFQFLQLPAEKYSWHALEVITYFLENTNRPRWFLKCKEVIHNKS